MKSLLMVCIAACVTFSSLAQDKDLPDTKIKELKTGRPVKFNSIVKTDKVTVISFWATWCVPCMKEINAIKKKMKGWQEEQPFNFITVSMDESQYEALAKTKATSMGWKFPAYIDVNSDLMRSLNFNSIPFLMIVDKNGKVAYRHNGYDPGGENVVWEKVKELSK